MAETNNHVAVSVRCSSRREWIDSMQAVSERIFAIAGLDPDASYWPVLAVREAVMNAVMHGNKERPDSEVTVDFRLGPERIEVSVQDQGEGFDPETLGDPLAAENLLSEGGRGVYLIRQLMDEVSFSFPEGGGTRIEMVKNLDGGD